MTEAQSYAVPLSELDAVHVPLDQQVAEQDTAQQPEYVAPEELDRARLLGTTGAGRLRVRD